MVTIMVFGDGMVTPLMVTPDADIDITDSTTANMVAGIICQAMNAVKEARTVVEKEPIVGFAISVVTARILGGGTNPLNN